MIDPDDLIRFGPKQTEAEKWKEICIGLIVLIIFVLLVSHGFFGYGDPYQ